MNMKERKMDRALNYRIRIGSMVFKTVDLLYVICLWIFALIIRIKLFPIESADYYGFLKLWMDQIRELGYFRSLGTEISNYSSSYMYLMCLVGVLTDDSLTGLKVVSTVFDYAASVAVFLIIWELTHNTRRALIGMSILLLSPTVILDSAYWCQCDIIYTSLILFALYFFLKDNSRLCFIMLGIAFSFKLQTLFILPFLVIMYLKKRKINPLHLLYLPAIYVVSSLPAWMFGRSFKSLMSVYFSQGSYYPWGTLEYPNIYALMDEVMPDGHHMTEVTGAGTFLTIMLLGVLAYLIYTKKFRLTEEAIITIALFSVAVTVFFLPHMHDRYGFLVDLLAIVYAVQRPKKLPVLCGFFLVSMLTFMPYLIGVHLFDIRVVTLMLLALIILVGMDLYAQMQLRPAPAAVMKDRWVFARTKESEEEDDTREYEASPEEEDTQINEASSREEEAQDSEEDLSEGSDETPGAEPLEAASPVVGEGNPGDDGEEHEKDEDHDTQVEVNVLS